MAGCLFARPTWNIAPTGTPTWAVGSVNGAFPLANVLTLEPDTPAKSTSTTATLRLTFGGAQTLVALACINCNFPGLTVALTNNGGMVSQSRVVPNPGDGLSINVWWDLRTVASASATQWNVAVTGAPTGVAIGTILALTAIDDDTEIRWDYEIRARYPVIEHRTGHQKRLQYRIPVRSHTFAGQCTNAADRNTLRALRQAAHGSITPWLFVPDEDDDAVHLVQFADTEASERYEFFAGRFDTNTVEGIVEQPIALEEVSSGVEL